MSLDLQQNIQNLLNTLVADGKEHGVQAAVYIDGKLEVDAWAGVADVRTGRAVDGDTLFPVFSTTKGVLSTIVHILAERGKLDYDTPIAKVWPEFAANGKEAITLRHAMSHTAGVPWMPDELFGNFTLEQTCDWNLVCSTFAKVKPIFPAGSRQQYHPVTFGYLLGEVACRVAGRTIPQLFAEEICRPLGVSGIYCGLPAELDPQVAVLVQTPVPATDRGTPPDVMCPPCFDPLHAWLNQPLGHRASSPGANGIMNARSIARHYAALLPGGVDGIELLPQSRLALATEEQVPGEGKHEGYARRGLGYGLGEGGSATGFGHGGYGGSVGYANPPYKLAVGLTKNYYTDNDLNGLVTAEVRKALKISS